MTSLRLVNPDATHDKSSRAYVVSWVNSLLRTQYSDVTQLSSGASYCKLLETVVPNSVDLTKVRDDSKKEEDYEHNVNLLQQSLNKCGIAKELPVKNLITGDFRSNYELLKWFRVFYMVNVKPKGSYRYSENNSKKNGIVVVESDENSTETSKTYPYTDQWKQTYPWVNASALGVQFTYCRVCHRNLRTFLRGTVDLRRHSETNIHNRREGNTRNRTLLSQAVQPMPCSWTGVQYVCHYFDYSGKLEPRQFARSKLGLKYPRSFTSVCQHTPYTLYVYGGIPQKHAKVIVVLVSYFDTEGPKYCHHFLDALEAETTIEEQKTTVVGILNRFDLPSANLAVIYQDGHGAPSEILAEFTKLSPNIMSFSYLYGVADAACAAALKLLSNKALELLVDIYDHHTCCTIKNETLSALFGPKIFESSSVEEFISKSCLNLFQIVSNLVEMWAELTSYFEECSAKNARSKLILSQLENPKVRAKYMILCDAIKPLHTFQTNLQPEKGESQTDLVVILELASNLLQSYTSHFLQPQAELDFLNEKDCQILKNTDLHLPSTSMNLGGPAVQKFLKDNDVLDTDSLQQEAVSLYIALTSSVTRALPVGALILQSMAQLLNPRSKQTVTGKAVEDIGVKLGLCSSPEQKNQLQQEFAQYQGSAEEHTEEEKDNTTESLEKYWAKVLKNSQPSSVFRKLILTLLAMPRPPLESKEIIAQALKNNSDAIAVTESDTVTESDSDVTSDNCSNGKIDRPFKRKYEVLDLNGVDVSTLRPCEVRLNKIKDGETWWKEEGTRGHCGWESSLRQRPAARSLFQAGSNTWAKPAEEVNANGVDSQDEAENAALPI